LDNGLEWTDYGFEYWKWIKVEFCVIWSHREKLIAKFIFCLVVSENIENKEENNARKQWHDFLLWTYKQRRSCVKNDSLRFENLQIILPIKYTTKARFLIF